VVTALGGGGANTTTPLAFASPSMRYSTCIVIRSKRRVSRLTPRA